MDERRYVSPPPRSTRDYYDASTTSRGFGIRNKPVVSHDGNYAWPGPGEVKIYRRVGPDGVMTVVNDAEDVEDALPPPLSPAESRMLERQVEALRLTRSPYHPPISPIYGDGSYQNRKETRPSLGMHERQRRGRNDSPYGNSSDEDEEDLFPPLSHPQVRERERKPQRREKREKMRSRRRGRRSRSLSSTNSDDITYYDLDDEGDPFEVRSGKGRYLSGLSGHDYDDEREIQAAAGRVGMRGAKESGAVYVSGYGAFSGGFTGGTMSYGGDDGEGEGAVTGTGTATATGTGRATDTETGTVGVESGTGTGTGEGLYDLLSQYTNLREEEIVGVSQGY